MNWSVVIEMLLHCIRLSCNEVGSRRKSAKLDSRRRWCAISIYNWRRAHSLVVKRTAGGVQ